MTIGQAQWEPVVDAVVIGAGLAGLTAARELEAAGASVLLVEANDRVGGRTITRRVGGVPVEMGGQWIGRGYAGVPTPGFFMDHGPALQEPVGRVHWAGTETATAWNGYMDGAVESGYRAEREVLSTLSASGAGYHPPSVSVGRDLSRGRSRAGATGTGG